MRLGYLRVRSVDAVLMIEGGERPRETWRVRTWWRERFEFRRLFCWLLGTLSCCRASGCACERRQRDSH